VIGAVVAVVVVAAVAGRKKAASCRMPFARQCLLQAWQHQRLRIHRHPPHTGPFQWRRGRSRLP